MLESALNVDSIEHKSVSEQVRNSSGDINVLRNIKMNFIYTQSSLIHLYQYFTDL